jgi:hypothetical protein
MNAFTVSPVTGRITGSPDAIAKLKALAAQDARSLGLDGPIESARAETIQRPPAPVQRRPVVEPQFSSRDEYSQPVDAIEAELTGLMTRAAAGAAQAFRLADDASIPGGSVEAYAVAASRAARYCQAYAQLTVALSRYQGKSQRLVIEHLVHRIV